MLSEAGYTDQVFFSPIHDGIRPSSGGRGDLTDSEARNTDYLLHRERCKSELMHRIVTQAESVIATLRSSLNTFSDQEFRRQHEELKQLRELSAGQKEKNALLFQELCRSQADCDLYKAGVNLSLSTLRDLHRDFASKAPGLHMDPVYKQVPVKVDPGDISRLLIERVQALRNTVEKALENQEAEEIARRQSELQARDRMIDDLEQKLKSRDDGEVEHELRQRILELEGQVELLKGAAELRRRSVSDRLAQTEKEIRERDDELRMQGFRMASLERECELLRQQVVENDTGFEKSRASRHSSDVPQDEDHELHLSSHFSPTFGRPSEEHIKTPHIQVGDQLPIDGSHKVIESLEEPVESEVGEEQIGSNATSDKDESRTQSPQEEGQTHSPTPHLDSLFAITRKPRARYRSKEDRAGGVKKGTSTRSRKAGEAVGEAVNSSTGTTNRPKKRNKIDLSSATTATSQ